MYNPISLIPNQTNINQTQYFFLEANVSTLNVNNISTGTITSQNFQTSTMSSGTAFIHDVEASTLYALTLQLDNQVLTATPTELLLNGIPLATTSNISSIQDWALEPAISDVNMNGNNLLSTNTVSSVNVRAQNGLFQNLIAFNTMFISSYVSSISSQTEAIEEGLFSSISCGTGFIDNLSATQINSLSSINGQDINNFVFSTIEVLSSISVPQLYVSSINGSEFTSTGINIQVAGVSSLVANSISSLGSEIKQALVSTIQFKPEFKLDFNFDFAALGAGIKSGLTNIGIGLGGGLVAIASGIVASATSRTKNTTINQITYEQYAMPTQIQFSTLGDYVSSYIRLVSSTGAGNEVPGDEIIVSTIINPGTLCIRSIGDPVNLADPSTFTSSIQSFGQWVEVPVGSFISSINDWSYFPAISTITFSPSVPAVIQCQSNLSLIAQNSVDVNVPMNIQGVNYFYNPSPGNNILFLTQSGSGGSNYVNVALNTIDFGNTNATGFTFVPAINRLAYASSLTTRVVLETTDLVNISSFSVNANSMYTSTISTLAVYGADSNLFGLGLQGMTIESPYLFLSSANVIQPGNYNGSTMSLSQGNIRGVIASTITTSTINVNTISCTTIDSSEIFTSSLKSDNISTAILTTSTLNGFTPPLQQFGVSTFQASAFSIELPRFYANTNYGIQLTPMSNTLQVPHASTISISSILVHAGGGLSIGIDFFWQTIGTEY